MAGNDSHQRSLGSVLPPARWNSWEFIDVGRLWRGRINQGFLVGLGALIIPFPHILNSWGKGTKNYLNSANPPWLERGRKHHNIPPHKCAFWERSRGNLGEGLCLESRFFLGEPIFPWRADFCFSFFSCRRSGELPAQPRGRCWSRSRPDPRDFPLPGNSAAAG